MLFSSFSLYLQKIEAVSARLEITAILAELFAKLADDQDEEQLSVATYLMQGSLLPSYQSLEFQMSEKMLIKTLARLQAHVAINYSPLEQELTKQYKQIGDIGQLFETVLAQMMGSPDQDVPTNPSQDLSGSHSPSLTSVYQALRSIALASGAGSQERKMALLAELLNQLDPLSARYISRIILSKMRLGFSTMTLIDALSFVKNQDKSDSANLEKAFYKKADLGKLVAAYLIKHSALSSEELLQTYQVEIGIPILPVLCQRLNSAVEIIDKMGEVMAEPKYDGLRVQIHINQLGFADNGLPYKAFTRNLDDVTHMFPELAQVVTAVSARQCILDSEAIGIDKQTGGFLPFQETIQRKRKHDVSAKSASVPICFYAFDLILLDDQVLVEQDLLWRKQKLAQIVSDCDVVKKTVYQLIDDPVKLKEFHEQQLALGLEGAVMKQKNSKYVAGRKSWRWVKIKEEEGSQGKLSDTIDCLMMGYYVGKGKRQAFGIGALLVGVLDTDQDGQRVVRSLSKIGTGLTDEQFREVKALADAHLTQNNHKPVVYDVDKNLFPDVWLEPSVVLEIAADEISKSPIHTAGVALRFPRLVQIRHDKSFEEATTVEELGAIHIGT